MLRAMTDPRLPRRRLLAGLAAAAGRPPLAAQGTPPGPAGALPTRIVPSTGRAVPVIGLGSWITFNVGQDAQARAECTRVIGAFLDGGGTVIDSSPMYGSSQDVIGQALRTLQAAERAFAADKVWTSDGAMGAAQAEASRRLWGVPRFALLQVHNLRNLGQALPYARELKSAGKTKYIGLTHFRDSAHAELADLMRKAKPDFVQINYSVSAPNAARRVLPVARDSGVAVMVNRAFDDGRLFARVAGKPLPGWAAEAGITSWAQLFLKFALSHEAVTVVIPATGKPDRQSDNLLAGHGPTLTAAMRTDLVALFA